MKSRKILILAALWQVLSATAQNPFVQTWFTSDPAPLVVGDRLYVYTGHDEDGADSSGCRNGGCTPPPTW